MADLLERAREYKFSRQFTKYCEAIMGLCLSHNDKTGADYCCKVLKELTYFDYILNNTDLDTVIVKDGVESTVFDVFSDLQSVFYDLEKIKGKYETTGDIFSFQLEEGYGNDKD